MKNWIGKFRIESSFNDTKYECDRTISSGELQCNWVIVRTESPVGSENMYVSETVAIAPNLSDEWSLTAGIMTVSEKQIAHTRMYVRLYGPHENMNVFYDDVSVVPIPRACDSLLLNSDFETGDTRFWKPSDRRYIDVNVMNVGNAEEPQYSMIVEKYTSHRIQQDLDTRCITEGQEFQINAKFKLLNTTDYTSGVDCIPTILSAGNQNACPSITIRGTNCANGNIDYFFWNDIDQFNWNPDGFNAYEKVFTVDADFASCEVSYSICF